MHLCALSAQIAHHPCQPALGGVYPAGAAFVLTVCIGPFIGAVGFQLEPASLVTLKVALVTTQTILIDFFNATQSWVKSLYTAL